MNSECLMGKKEGKFEGSGVSMLGNSGKQVQIIWRKLDFE